MSPPPSSQFSDSAFEITQKPAIRALVVRTRLSTEKDFAASMQNGMQVLGEFLKTHKLERFVRQDEGSAIFNYPEDPFENGVEPIFVEPGLLLADDAPLDELRELLKSAEVNPEPSSSTATPEEIKRGRAFGVMETKPGTWAVYHLKGSYSQLKNLWGTYIFEKTAQIGREPDWSIGGCFEHYLNSCANNKEEDFLTDICLPVTDVKNP